MLELDNGKGVVAYIDETGKSGFVVSIAQSELMHYASYGETMSYWPTSESNYQENYDKISEWELPSNAQSWASTCGKAGWRVPAKDQLKQIFKEIDKINKAIDAEGGTKLDEEMAYYWSSTTKFEDGIAKNFVYSYVWGDGDSTYTPIVTGKECYTRAIHAFKIE